MFEDRYNYEADATFTDEALAAHKILANTLQQMVLLSEPIIAKIKEYNALVEEKAAYDELTKNGDRLRDRKYSMTHEENLRKRVSRLPLLSDALISELTKWKAQNNAQPFIYNGIDYLQYLLAERTRAEEEKAQRQLRRGISATPSSKQQPAISTLPTMTPSRKTKTSQSSSLLTASSSSSNGLPASTPSRKNKPTQSTSSLQATSSNALLPVTPARNSNRSTQNATTPAQHAPAHAPPPAITEESASSRSRANTTDGMKVASSLCVSENQEQINN